MAINPCERRRSSRFRVSDPPWRRDVAGDLPSDDAVDEHADEVQRLEYWLTAGPPTSLVLQRIECEDGDDAWAYGPALRRWRTAIDHCLGRRIPLGVRIQIDQVRDALHSRPFQVSLQRLQEVPEEWRTRVLAGCDGRSISVGAFTIGSDDVDCIEESRLHSVMHVGNFQREREAEIAREPETSSARLGGLHVHIRVIQRIAMSIDCLEGVV